MGTGRVLEWSAGRMSNHRSALGRIAAMDPVEAPMYSAADVALYTGVPPSTLHYWLTGTFDDPTPLIVATGDEFERRRLSFANLLEAHILLAARSNEIPLPNIRKGLTYLRERHPNAPHPLLSYARNFYYADNRRDLFIQMMEGDDPINATKHGQVAFGEVMNRHLHRIEWESSSPVRVFPMRSEHIVIDVNVSGGQPVLKGTGILARMLLGRNKAGESVQEIAKDYRLKVSDVKEAIRFLDAA